MEHCKKPSVALAYFYFDFNDTENQKVSTLVSSLVVQLCSKRDDPPEQLVGLFKECKQSRRRATMRELKTLLSLLVRDLEDVFIVIDALDECPKGYERGELLQLIRDIKSWSLPNLHLLSTSRQEPDIEDELTPLLTSAAIPIQGSEVESDIKLYIASELATALAFIAGPSSYTLAAGANGM